jgi:2-polyprenyl-6-methoxyphenol hydroxylase-like FAD-dependent oxidoreductase
VPELPTFGDWHDPIPELFATAEDVITSRLHELDRPLPALHSGRVAFVGDAAHPMTPFLAQGACQAMEDAVTLARLADPSDIDASLTAYTAARITRTRRIVRRSRRVGDAILRPGRVGSAVRDRAATLGRWLPDDVIARSFDGVFSWQPPDPVRGRAAA